MNIYILLLLLLLEVEFLAVIYLQFKSKRSKPHSKRPTFIDTSVLMDGRIIAAVQAGFVPDELIIPQSVIAELQLLADGSDSDKRSRARHGLDVAALMQDNPHVPVTVLADGPAPDGVDDKLRELARKYDGTICTIDFNLNKVAVVEKIPVLNINELAQQLRMNHLPGEKVSITVMQKGNDGHQGVGYLSDGTMVVIEQAQSDIGKQVDIEFIRSLQTVAGRMLFAKKVNQPNNSKPNQPHRKQPEKKAFKGRKPSSKRGEDSLIELVNDQKSS